MHFLSWTKNSIKENKALSLIILIGFLLRFISVYPGYFYPHGDELLYSQAIYMIINKTLGLQPHYLGFPPLIPWLMIPFFLLVFIPAFWLISLLGHFMEIYFLFIPLIGLFVLVSFVLRKKFIFVKTFLLLSWLFLVVSGTIVISKGTLFHGEILGRNWLNVLYWGRYITALFGTGVIFLVYKTVLAFFNNKRAAILAALFTGVNYRLVLNSHIGLPDMYNVFFLVLSLLLIGKLLGKASLGNYFKTWLSLAVSFLVKYQVHVFIPFLIAHIIVSTRLAKGKLKKLVKNFFRKEVLLGGLTALAIVFISHIYHFRNWERVQEINNYEILKYGFGRNIFNLYALSYLYHVGIGSALTLSAVAGIVLGLLRGKTREASLILLSVLPTFGFLYLYYTGGGFYTRNLIAVIPILMVFSAIFIDWILSQVDKLRIFNLAKTASASALVLIIIFPQLKNSVLAAQGLSSPSPFTQVQSWLDLNIEGPTVFGRYSGDPVPSGDGVVLKTLPSFSESFSFRELSQEGFDQAIINLGWIRAQFLWWMRKDPPVQIKLWNKPDDLLSQNYYALAFRELLWSHGLALSITPWQAPTMQYAVVDLEKSSLPSSEQILLDDYEDFPHWEPFLFLETDRALLTFLKNDGKTKLSIQKGDAMPGGVRWQSKAFAVEENKGYQIVGEIENSDKVPKDDRQVFLRLDFYREAASSRPVISFVSERVYGNPGSHAVSIYATSPEGANFATISFQGTSSQSDYTLNSLKIYQSRRPVLDKEPQMTIEDDDLFFPNDDGIL